MFVTTYIDDILVYTNRTLEKYKKYVKKILHVLQEVGIRLHLDKSVFHTKKVEYLGLILTTEGIYIDNLKTAVVQNWLTLKNFKKV